MTAATTTRTTSRRAGTTAPAARTAAAQVGGAGDLGKNLRYTIEGNELVIRINLDERHGPSASGKTTIVATSSGNQQVPGTPVIIGLNAYTKP